MFLEAPGSRWSGREFPRESAAAAPLTRRSPSLWNSVLGMPIPEEGDPGVPVPPSALAPGQTSGRGSGISPLWIGSSPRCSGREVSIFHLPPPDLKMPFFPPFPSAQQRNTQTNKKRAIPNQVRPEAHGIPAPRGGQGRRSGMSGPQLGQQDPSPSLNICSSGRAWTWKSRNSGAEQERNSCLEPAGFGTNRAGDAALGVGGEGLGTGRAPGCPGSRVPPSPALRGISG